MEKAEKQILKGIYAITMLMFSLLSISSGSFNYMVLLFGLASCILVGYGHFVIRHFFPEGDKFLVIIAAFLVQFGLIMLYRLTPSLAWKQLAWFAIGMGTYILIVMFLPNVSRFGRLKYLYIIIAILMLGATLVLGTEKKGSINWIMVGGFSIQPSEIAKLFLILYCASALRKVESFKQLLIAAIPVFVAIGLLVIEKDLGAALIFFGIFITVLYVSSSNILYVAIGTGSLGIMSVISYFLFSHVRVRVAIWRNPWKYSTGIGYQICQSLFAVAAGGLFGTGIGLGHPNLIPLAYSDLIFSAICEEMGILGALAVIILYLILVYRGLRTAMYTKNTFSRLVAVGISSMLFFQVFVIIGGSIKMIPLTGITMPFVSYGGSSMLLNFASLGVLQKISETSGGNRNEE